MRPIRTLIVDDEPPALNRLRWLLRDAPDIEIVAEAGDGESALCAIARLRPDLLFLDVQIPAPDGLAVLRAAREDWLPCTIFTTAFSQHAVQAFELNAIDYLLKPFDAERLALALGRARERLAAGGEDARLAGFVERAASRAPECYLVKDGESYTVVRPADIVWAESAGNYMVLHTPGGNRILRRTVAALSAELETGRFFRTNRSAIVNLDHIEKIEPGVAGEFILRLRGGIVVPMTRPLRELKDKMGALT